MSGFRVARTWVEIDLSALQGNLAAVRTHLGEGGEVMAVVKANAYGHGVIPVVRALRGRVEMLGVANVAEAREVLPVAGSTPIYLLGPALPEERAEVVAGGYVAAISSLAEAEAYSALAGPGRQVPVHLTIDSGMGRIGFWQEEVAAQLRAVLRLPGVRVTGVASHLPVADEDEAFTREEITGFRAQVAELRAMGLPAGRLHFANSAGLMGFPVLAGEMVRAGLTLYGASPLPQYQSQLRPVLCWKTRVTLVRNMEAGRGISYGRTFITPHAMRVATLAVGYADGFQRHLSNRGAEVLIRGRRCPVLGRVTMDQILVDVSALPGVEPGEEVVLIGRQGSEEILAAELAQRAGGITWEIFTGIGTRVERRFFEG